jgi:biopolymer transport protein ExbB
MFVGKSVWQILNMGGFTMYVLLACSVISLTIFLERIYQYWKNSVNRFEFMKQIRAEIDKSSIDVAIKICEMKASSVANVICAGLRKYSRDQKEIAEAMEREVLVEAAKLERFTAVVGIIGNVAVYIGLFGTVLGIINSFQEISSAFPGGSGGGTGSMPPGVIAGIAEALICTATGLFVAVPSVVAHNYFIRRVDGFVLDMEYCSSELNEILATSKGAQ